MEVYLTVTTTYYIINNLITNLAMIQTLFSVQVHSARKYTKMKMISDGTMKLQQAVRIARY